MKFGIAVLVGFVVCLFPSVHGMETDEVRVFDDNLDLTDTEMQRYLKQADLESHGFEKSVEWSTVSDKYGRKARKTIYYKVRDDCSKIRKWAKILKDRMPEALKRGGDIFKKTVKEVKSRIVGRKTKECTFMLEVHPSRCLGKSHKTTKRGAAKRCGRGLSPKCCSGCTCCSCVAIAYAD